MASQGESVVSEVNPRICYVESLEDNIAVAEAAVIQVESVDLLQVLTQQIVTSESKVVNEVVDETDVTQESHLGLPPPRKRGRPRKIKTATEETYTASPKKGVDVEWTNRRADVVLNTQREAVVTRTRTGRTPRRSIFGDDFVSPFDTKIIKEELDRTNSSKPMSFEKRGRGRPKLNKPVPPPNTSADANTPVKRGRGRPIKGTFTPVQRKDLEDVDLLEEVGSDDDKEARSVVDSDDLTEAEQEILQFLETNGEDDFQAWLEKDTGTSEEALTGGEIKQENFPEPPAVTELHSSIYTDINHIVIDRCTTEGCNCSLFHCPLCAIEYFKPVEYCRVILKHLEIHVKYGVKFLDVICCACRLDCHDVKALHFHCPVCVVVMNSLSSFTNHLQKHNDVEFVLDSEWRTKSGEVANDQTPNSNQPENSAPAPVLEEPVLSNVTAVLTTEFLEHIGATENTEAFLREKLAMEKVFVTKVGDQWIIHGAWEDIQKAYARLKKLHNDIKNQKLREQQPAIIGKHVANTVAESDTQSTVSDGSQPTDQPQGSAVTPKQEVIENEGQIEKTQSVGVEQNDSQTSCNDLVMDDSEMVSKENIRDPDYHPKPKVRIIRRTRDEIKALGIKLKCRHCGIIKHSKDSLYRHIWRCHKEKAFECGKCGRPFGMRTDMVRHQSMCKGPKAQLPDPEGDGPYSCDLCDKVLQTRETLKAHHKYLHTDAGSCVCHLCGKNFRAPRYLKAHLVRHSDVRSYICGICSKTFKERSTLKEHLGTHKDPDDRIKKFKCELCPRAYFRHAALMDHMNFHAGTKPYSCENCGRAFIGRCALKKHMLSHMETKTYDCERCGKSFKFKHKLESHFVTHTGFSKHVCTLCGKCFTTSTTLRKHSCKGVFQMDKLLMQNQDKQTLQLFMCSLCNLTFTEWTEVASHMLLHNEAGDTLGENNTENGTVQIELQSQDLINLADAAANASLAAAGDLQQTEDMQSVMNAIAQVQRMENGVNPLDDEVAAETQQALAQIQYNQIQIKDNNIVNVIQESAEEPRQVTIHLEDQEQYQIVQEQLAANPEQFQIIQENTVGSQEQFDVIQEAPNDPQGQFQVIGDDIISTDNFRVVQGDGVDQGPFQIIQGEPGTQGNFQIIHNERSGEFRVIHQDPINQGNFEVIQNGGDQSQFQVVQETTGDTDFDPPVDGVENNQFHVVPGSDTDDRSMRVLQTQTSESSNTICSIGDIPIEQFTTVTHIALNTEQGQGEGQDGQLVESVVDDQLYDGATDVPINDQSVVVLQETHTEQF